MRRLGRRALYLLGVLVVVGGALELGCRLGLLPTDAARDRAQLARARGPHRVLLLGDSFTVEDPRPGSLTLGNQLKRFFAEHDIGVVNLAAPGYGPGDSVDRLALFRHYAGDRYRPDVILFDYYAGNDLTDTLFRLHGGTPRVVPPPSGAWGHLWLARLVEEIAVRRGWLKLRPIPGALPPHDRPAPRGQAYDAARSRALNPYIAEVARHYPQLLLANLLLEGPLVDEAVRANFTFLHELHRIADEQGARLVVAIFPSTLQVSDSHLSFYRDLGFDLDPRLRSDPVIQKRLLAFCADERILCIDLLPAFQEHAETEHYMAYDDHWRTEGQTLAARTLEAALANAGLLGLTPAAARRP